MTENHPMDDPDMVTLFPDEGRRWHYLWSRVLWAGTLKAPKIEGLPVAPPRKLTWRDRLGIAWWHVKQYTPRIHIGPCQCEEGCHC